MIRTNHFILNLIVTLACAQNIHAMRCTIKSLMQLNKSRPSKAVSFCNKSDTSNDLKQLQRIHKSLIRVNPNCFNVLTESKPCEYQDSCCLLAKNNAEQAKQIKILRLQKENLEDDQAYIKILRSTEKGLTSLLRRHVDAQSIVSESHDKEALEPLHKEIRELITNLSECLVYSANIYGITYAECSARYYKTNPRGLFDGSKHMTAQEREREDLQDECNTTYNSLMRGIGCPRNKIILLGWGEHTMDPDYVSDWWDDMSKMSKGHDHYKKNGGGVY